MTYYREIKLIDKIGDEKGISSIGKKQFNQIFSDYICREWLWVAECTKEEFCSFVKKHQSVLVKTNGTCSGDNIYKYTHTSDYETMMEYEKIKDKHTLVEEILQQHHSLTEFNPASVNTVRIGTLYHKGKVYLLSSAMRIGAGDVPTDNLHGKGVAVAVDLETRLTISHGYTNLCEQYLLHPISLKPLIGFQIPNWDTAKKTVIEAAELAYKRIGSKFVGRDVAMLENGVALIEANPHQANDLLQIGRSGIWKKIKDILDE
ncbi:sugar-transfer associated ATP-grasp domain-containing protein [Anaerostipes faecalis]|uniref:sugar-transfer associated ATP-grasp domain-containing protein n=1 Tax=Anaerostipes faecalis TaxID=2738446 RepID=UPI003F0C72F9